MPATPYRVWLSEIMLQQTQVATVVPYFTYFVEQIPDIKALANAELDRILALWSGLGYYTRARNLHKAARYLAQHHNAQLPESLELLQSLPGIGRSTAGAIMSLGFKRPAPILDGNIKRLFARYFTIEGYSGEAGVQKMLWGYAEKLIPDYRIDSYNQALMDIGATLCTRRLPSCESCPLQSSCLARHQSRQHQLPTPKPKRIRPTKKIFLLLLKTEAGILLERRPEIGVWGGLWSLPEMSSPDNWPAWMPKIAAKPKTLTVIRHAFTHFKLDITPVKLELQSAPTLVSETPIVWYQANDEIGLPAPIKKLLERELAQ